MCTELRFEVSQLLGTLKDTERAMLNAQPEWLGLNGDGGGALCSRRVAAKHGSGIVYHLTADFWRFRSKLSEKNNQEFMLLAALCCGVSS